MWELLLSFSRIYSTLHALDHVGRLTETVDEIAKTKLTTEGPEELQAAMLCAESMRSAAALATQLSPSLAPPSRNTDDEARRRRTVTASGQIATATAKSLRGAATDAVERLKSCSEELSVLRAIHRRATLDSVASGTLTASAAITRVDAVGLLDGLAHHAW